MKRKRSVLIVAIMILTGLSAAASATDTVSSSEIPDELIARKLKKHDPSLAISVEAVLYKIKRSQPPTLVDVRRQHDFERLHIPGSINLPLHAVKTRTYLKPVQVVLVNEGLHYAEMQTECRRLTESGFKISILDGGLPAWQRKGGRLSGDLFALEEIKTVLPRTFFRAKDDQNMLVLDISPKRSEASNRLFPYAKHIPLLDASDGLPSELRRLNKKSKPFQSIVILNESGEQYEKAAKMMNRMGVEPFHLQGGVVAYRKYLDGLMLSWKPRDSRIKTVGKCKPCGEKAEQPKHTMNIK